MLFEHYFPLVDILSQNPILKCSVVYYEMQLTIIQGGVTMGELWWRIASEYKNRAIPRDITTSEIRALFKKNCLILCNRLTSLVSSFQPG
jgi:hypothetical protein